MPKTVDIQARIQRLRRFLGRVGPASGRQGREALGIGQSAFSRLVCSAPDELLLAGRGRATRYAARRPIPGVDLRVPIYAVSDGESQSRLIALLHSVEPAGFYLESRDASVGSGFYQDLPYFLYDLRPAGFLGRLIPRRHPELELPSDIRFWTAEHCLRYLVRHGWDMPGNLICGQEAFRLYLARVQSPPSPVAHAERRQRYPRLADEVLASGPPGSSTAGEHPKFTATRLPERQPVLVKFSPPTDSRIGRRIADLLICEHLALETLASCGHPAARSELIQAAGRVFLELERFDRLGVARRRGTLALTALDAELVGRLGRWTRSLEDLVRAGRATAADLELTSFRELFGRLIGNSDMHPGNLSFFVEGERTSGLAPAYDMLPAAYAPMRGECPEPPFEPAPPAPSEATVWTPAHEAAVGFWAQAARQPGISRSFQRIAAANAATLERMGSLADLLP